jgi:hypothetical protein
MTDKTFTLRKNAKRAAEKMISAGAAPSINYGFKEREDGRFEIVWHTTPTPAPAPTEGAFYAALAAETAAGPDTCPRCDKSPCECEEELYGPVEPPADKPEPAVAPLVDAFPKGQRVLVLTGKHKVLGRVDYRVDAQYLRVFVDGKPPSSILYHQDKLTPVADGTEPEPVVKRARLARLAAAPREKSDRKPSKNAELDAAAARGEMPAKPDITSPANQHYRPRFDKLEALAKADKWAEIEAFEVKGVNSYAKMLKQYRDRLLSARAALQKGGAQ